MTTHDNHPLARIALYITQTEASQLIAALQDSTAYAEMVLRNLDSDDGLDDFDAEIARDALKDNAALATRLEALLPKD